MLVNQTKFELYLHFSDWFNTRWSSIWCPINRKSVTRFIKDFSVLNVAWKRWCAQSRSLLKPLNTIVLRCYDEFQGCPQLSLRETRLSNSSTSYQCCASSIHWENYISISLQIEWNMIVVIVFLSISKEKLYCTVYSNQMVFHLA